MRKRSCPYLNKKLTALVMGLAVGLLNPVQTLAVPSEQRISLDPQSVEIVDVSEDTEEEETTVQKVEVYEDIRISTPEDLAELALKCRVDTWSVDKRILLMNDITVYESDFTTIPTFGGYFEGQGYTIKGISTDKKGYAGLFDYTQPTAVIANLNVEGILRPEGSAMVIGGIVGDNYGVIQNCSFAGTVKGKDYIGGIAGFNEVGGSIIDCTSYGKITGVHYTGGICGENAGGIANCTNSSNVNITVDDTKASITDFSLDTYKQSLLSIFSGNESEKKNKTTTITGSIDTGGIAGLSLGAVTGCTNRGTIGYEHVGYNTGGIAGRSSGYIEACENYGPVYGRKDVGGIVGQAEPYVQLDLTQDIIAQITANIGDLHDLIDTTLTDAGNVSDVIAMRLNVVKSFADKALDDTNFLANSAEYFVDNAMSTANEAISRIDFVLEELDKEDGVFDNLSESASEAKHAAQQIKRTVQDISIEKYMTDSDREAYYYAREQIDLAADGHDAAIRDVFGEDYDPTAEELIERADEIEEAYMERHGGNERQQHGDGDTFAEQMENYADTITRLVRQYVPELTDQEVRDIKKFASYVEDTGHELREAGESAREIVSNLNGRDRLVLPTLGDDFHVRTNSLNTNMQGISDNLGFLNQEVSGSADTLIGDLADVNDQFNKLLLLITDAMDGALEMDYVTTYEDNSDDVAETCIDGTVADSLNNAKVEGDLDVGGIAGTMAIEYEFDLESDITGIKDSKVNSTYLSKCVLRSNVNNNPVTSEKSYIGGIVGLQEMGTVLRCENYGKVLSKSGDYVGGIAGESLSTIKLCAASSIENGKDYVGGIVGKGDDIYDCFAIPNIEEAENYRGGIAGAVEDNGTVKNNYFCGSQYAGIDQISFTGKAEPLSYEEMLGREGVPRRFRSFMIRFTLDDDEVGALPVVYGDSLEESKFPVPELKEGYYAEWEIKELTDIASNVEVKAEEHKYVTTLAGDRLRDDGQSMLLVDGSFKEGDALSVESVIAVGLPIENVTEHYVASIPDDGTLTHTLRYQPLPGEEVLIYTRVGNEWRKVKTREYAGYELFDASGNTVEFAVSAVEGIDQKYILIGVAAAAVVLIVLFLIIYGHIKRKRRSQ
ncbi:MAG: hypothetical protein IJT16_05755 [Lachnospiraceae bacterium]|nr:hypothetical protein [Lachnospiraceae bacterium]